MKLKCKECGTIYEVDEDKVKHERYIQCPCPTCARISPNPIYEGGEK